MQYTKDKFSVGPSGTKEQQDKYREGYERIDWGK